MSTATIRPVLHRLAIVILFAAAAGAWAQPADPLCGWLEFPLKRELGDGFDFHNYYTANREARMRGRVRGRLNVAGLRWAGEVPADLNGAEQVAFRAWDAERDHDQSFRQFRDSVGENHYVLSPTSCPVLPTGFMCATAKMLFPEWRHVLIPVSEAEWDAFEDALGEEWLAELNDGGIPDDWVLYLGRAAREWFLELVVEIRPDLDVDEFPQVGEVKDERGFSRYNECGFHSHGFLYCYTRTWFDHDAGKGWYNLDDHAALGLLDGGLVGWTANAETTFYEPAEGCPAL